MSILRTDVITLHRMDNSEPIYVRADKVDLIESYNPPDQRSGALVYIGRMTRAVKENPKEVRDMVERAVS